MSPWLQLRRVNSILVEPLPLLKSSLGVMVVLLVVPVEHTWRVLDSNTVAESLDDFVRVVKKVVGVNHADIDGALGVAIGAIRLLASDLGSNLSGLTEVVKNTALLVVSSFGGHEVVEASHLVERWDGATVVAGNAVLGVTDEESKVELLEDCGGHNRRIAGLCLSGVWVWRGECDGLSGLGSIDLGSFLQQRGSVVAGTNSTLNRVKTRGNRGRLS